MKRSEINSLIDTSIRFCEQYRFLLPPFAYWTPRQWRRKGAECDEIRKAMLGWDLTDFGKGDFARFGLVLFTLRNGTLKGRFSKKRYAEKILIVEEGQATPMHFHWSKMEDIINRGGGTLLVKVYASTRSGELAKKDVLFSTDGVERRCKAGSVIRVRPGESITLTQGMYHEFWAEKGTGKILLGEVSTVNDDNVDNRFHRPLPRFPEIEEDEPARYLLGNEYPKARRQ